MGMGLGELWELVVDREAWHTAIHGVTKSRTQLKNWTELHLCSLLKHQKFLIISENILEYVLGTKNNCHYYFIIITLI